MKNNILDLIDLEKVDTLLEGFNKATGFVTAILDLNGNVLSKSGWRQICTDFHRINPETSKKCTISDTELAGALADGEKFHFYKCLNGLVDVAVPIVVNGEHIANLFSGQFFFEDPDRMFFKKQAGKYGFNEKEYLEALRKVPIVSKEKVLIAMDFLQNMTLLISEMTLQRLEQTELNSTISESEDRFKSVFESANVGKSITLPTGEIIVNKAFCKMLGYTRVELQNKKWQEITPEEEIPAIQKTLEHLLNREKDSARFEKRYICKNGTQIWADVSVSIRRDDRGKPLHFITTIIDITERKLAEEKLRTSEAKFRAVAELSPMAIYASSGSDQKAVYTNKAFYKIFGFSMEDIPTVGHWWIKAFPDEKYRQSVIDQWVYNIEQADKNNTDVEVLECICTCKDGSEKTIAWVGKTISDEFWAFGYDFTERIQAENALHESEQLLLESQKIARLGSYVWDLTLESWKSSGILDEIFGIDENFTRSLESWLTIIHPEWREKMTDYVTNEVVGKHQRIDKEYQIIRQNDGQVRWVHCQGELEFDVNKVPIKLIGTINDITERKQAEEKLEKQNVYIKMILDNFPIGIATNEIDSLKVTYMNRKFCEFYGWPEDDFPDIALFFEKVFPDMEYRQKMQTQILADLSSGDIERMNWDNLKISTKAGDQRIVHASNIPLLNQNIMVSTVQDITERKHAEEEIRRQLDELQRWHEVTLGREGRNMQLKAEVNNLLVRLGEPIRYPSQESASDKQDTGEGG